jgi:4-aminobutyrate aminotransferase-like enzyme
VQQICREHGILFIVDEVQSGFGRTGRWFALEHFGIDPDIIVMAKGIASGFPLSGIAARSEIMDKWIPGSHGGTYGGNAVSCAAAVATIRVIRDEKLIENSAEMGKKLVDQLNSLQDQFPVIGDVRGLGLMVATEFTTPSGEPDKVTAEAMRNQCLEKGLILLTCGSYGNVIRWIPPLNIEDMHLEEALNIFQSGLETTQS